VPRPAFDAPPNALAVARALAGREAVALVWANGGRTAYVACDPVAESRELDPEPSLALGARTEADFPRWFGLVPYEARRSLERRRNDARPEPSLVLPLWRRYDAVVEITNEVHVLGVTSHARHELEEKLARGLRAPLAARPARLSLRGPPEDGAAHAARIERALELIAQGEVYEVNLARAFELDVEGSLFDVFAALTSDGRPPYSAVFAWPELGVVAASPELCLALDTQGTARTEPIKGTRPRHPDPERDRELAEELDRDPKERAELAMVIDVERSDLGRVALPGSVRLAEAPHVASHPTVHHRVATVEARLSPEVTRGELFRAMLPSGSVTGAPKVRAMEVIAALEPARRGLYTGAFGVLGHDGSVELGMAIRVLTVAGGIGRYFSGGGIVADSEPAREVEETLWKAAAVLRAAGENAENWASEREPP
jgi:anthranilate/para-aminobenzoate synthase component I